MRYGPDSGVLPGDAVRPRDGPPPAGWGRHALRLPGRARTIRLLSAGGVAGRAGQTLSRAFASTPLCCSSRRCVRTSPSQSAGITPNELVPGSPASRTRLPSRSRTRGEISISLPPRPAIAHPAASSTRLAPVVSESGPSAVDCVRAPAWSAPANTRPRSTLRLTSQSSHQQQVSNRRGPSSSAAVIRRGTHGRISQPQHLPGHASAGGRRSLDKNGAPSPVAGARCVRVGRDPCSGRQNGQFEAWLIERRCSTPDGILERKRPAAD